MAKIMNSIVLRKYTYFYSFDKIFRIVFRIGESHFLRKEDILLTFYI